MANHLVSIITPSFNCKDYIEETYNSIVCQTYSNWEWLITDDCSTDGIYEYLVELSKLDDRIKLFRNNINSGAAVSRNNSIEKATGRFIAFLDSDDLWVEEKLSTQIKFMLENEVAFSYSDYSFINEAGYYIEKIRKTPESINYNNLLSENIIGCLTAVYDCQQIGKVYMPLIRRRQDYGLWLNILKMVPEAKRSPGVLGVYRLRTNSVSSNKLKLLKYNFELFYKHQKMSFFKAGYYLTLNILSKCFKKNKVST